jgi:hypothetical protein
MTFQHITSVLPSAAPVVANTHACTATQIVFFTHTVQNKANNIRFAHQSLCSPHISTLLKAIQHGYLKGCPNLLARGVTKYLNTSPATAKGHMKWPHKEVWSTQQRQVKPATEGPHNDADVPNNSAIIPIAKADDDSDSYFPIAIPTPGATIIEDNDNSDNVFVFAVFTDKHTGILYSDLTGTFPFMSLEGNVCFLAVYHYETNAILALPIANFSIECILAAYKQQFELLESKGHKIKLNVMDNQASWVIKKYLTSKQCDNLLVKPNNHCVNTAKQAIQMFKAHFISALATTDSKFPLQLWDCLTPQVKNTLNMLHPSQINPMMSAYKAINGPYNWNQFPLAPPGCKVVICKAPESCGSWASRGANAWGVGPSMDQYRCNHFFIPKTQAYHVLGSAELFSQHCQVTFLM